MSHTASRAVLVLAALTLAACASAPRVDRASEEAALQAQNQRLLAAIGARDVNTIASIYATDATVMMPNAPVITGSSTVRSGWADMFRMPDFQFSFTPTRLDLAKSGDMAVDIGTWRWSANGPQGRMDDAGTYTTEWKKVNGQWLIATDMATSGKPMPAPAVATVVIMESDQAQMQAAAGMTWSDFQLPGFAPGVKLAVLHGDPSKSGDYTLRLRFPDNYTVPPHWHPGGEHVTVLQGSFSFGMGNTFDRTALKTYGPGDFVFAPAKMAHFAQTRGETIVQLHGDGPFALNLVTAGDRR